ncbi:hypothetical protein [Rubritalea profundi]|uniref:N-sulphoglucosamine sulphohydrolase C-terminal domain-containing protein n=1 Tax=Rubritalea profundi TaxID=1658618 RepID=A0A2S7U563_9BACT|nr:hypothetical protein [Rubritalea profundi]PQJ29571.1 hypothetical protein BSZ32_14440 [Rubritalea profundi]
MRKKTIYWQWSAGGAIRVGKMKAVFWGKNPQWELYDISKDNNESNNLAQSKPEMLESMKKNWQDWRASTTP